MVFVTFVTRGQGLTDGGRNRDNVANLRFPTGGDFPYPRGQQSQEKHLAVSRESSCRDRRRPALKRGSHSRKKAAVPYWEPRSSEQRPRTRLFVTLVGVDSLSCRRIYHETHQLKGRREVSVMPAGQRRTTPARRKLQVR
ncbi:hypothetical protein NDU88_004845 [Pleurodeles waltl]|uniref:Uncharacterized protein n=1 Tax=Pleurodeles waltl TaxID=8319 RepID=A0AAV7W6D7_PLEWA|nr:hypothetical protein NDU88_004845 [Pleurodeles waltl]